MGSAEVAHLAKGTQLHVLLRPIYQARTQAGLRAFRLHIGGAEKEEEATRKIYGKNPCNHCKNKRRLYLMHEATGASGRKTCGLEYVSHFLEYEQHDSNNGPKDEE